MFIWLKTPLQDYDSFFYHSSRRFNRLLQAFKHRNLQHCGVLFLGGLLMFDITGLLFQSTSSHLPHGYSRSGNPVS